MDTTDHHLEGRHSPRAPAHSGGLKRRLLLVHLALTFTVLGASSWLFHEQDRRSLTHHLQTTLLVQAQLTADRVDGDLHAALRSRSDPAYATIQSTLRASRGANPSVRDVYTMTRADDGTWSFVVDAEPPDSPIFSELGTPYDATQDPTLPLALQGPVASPGPYTDEYGTWMSGYAPIRGADGRAVGIVGVDVSGEEFAGEERLHLLLTLLAFGLGCAASLLAGQHLLGRVADPVLVEQARQEAERQSLVHEREQALALARTEQERVTREAQFRVIFEHAPDALLLVESTGRVASANPPASALWPNLEGAPVPTELDSALASGSTDVRLPHPSPASLGEPLELELRRVALPVGDQPGALLLARDVSRERRAEREREEALARVREALAEREVLIQEIHHRVKNNLQMVSSLLEMQASGLEDSAKIALRQSVERVRAMALVHQMLYRHEDLSSIDLGDYARTMVSQLGDAAGGQAEVTFAADVVEIPMERAIPCGLILNELVTNALKHGRSPDGRCRLEVAVRRTEGGFLLRVADSGPGLPAGLTASSRSLGAKVVLALVRQLGGKLQLAEGPGSRFEVVVPAAA